MLQPSIFYTCEINDKFEKTILCTDKIYYLFPFPNKDSYREDFYNRVRCSDLSWAIVDENNENEVIGYISFNIDYFTSTANKFLIISFDKGNPIIGMAVIEVIDMLKTKYNIRRIEINMIGGNPVERHYDKIAKRYNGIKHVFREVYKDSYGKYHDSIVYEFLRY